MTLRAWWGSGTTSREEIEANYKISRRIEGEERALEVATMVFTSTQQEVRTGHCYHMCTSKTADSHEADVQTCWSVKHQNFSLSSTYA